MHRIFCFLHLIALLQTSFFHMLNTHPSYLITNSSNAGLQDFIRMIFLFYHNTISIFCYLRSDIEVARTAWLNAQTVFSSLIFIKKNQIYDLTCLKESKALNNHTWEQLKQSLPLNPNSYKLLTFFVFYKNLF